MKFNEKTLSKFAYGYKLRSATQKQHFEKEKRE